MLNSPDFDSTLEKNLNKSEVREKLWSDLFMSEYKPDYDFSSFFKKIEKYITKNSFFSFSHRNLKFLKTNKEDYLEVVNLVKNNNYKIDINFLESLDNNQKYLLSSIFVDSV
jgi:hypothetical protein